MQFHLLFQLQTHSIIIIFPLWFYTIHLWQFHKCFLFKTNRWWIDKQIDLLERWCHFFYTCYIYMYFKKSSCIYIHISYKIQVKVKHTRLFHRSWECPLKGRLIHWFRRDQFQNFKWNSYFFPSVSAKGNLKIFFKLKNL